MTDIMRNSWKSKLCKGTEIKTDTDERYAFIGSISPVAIMMEYQHILCYAILSNNAYIFVT